MNGFKKIGKAILITGTKGVAFSAGMALIATAVTGGLDGIKSLTLDELIK